MAKQNNEVTGAPLMGGDFGGGSTNIIKEDAVNDCIEQVTVTYKKYFSLLPEAYVVETSDGTGRINV